MSMNTTGKENTTGNGKKKRTGAGLLLATAGLLLILAGSAMTLRLPADRFEYVVPAPAFSADAPVQDTLDGLSETLEGYAWSAALRTQGAPVSCAGSNRGTATLYAVSERYFDLHHETLRAGRYISAEDIRTRRKAAVVNRRAADALLPGQDPLGRTLTCGGMELEIVGVTDGGFRPGETDEILLWVPVSLADTGSLGAATLEILVKADSQAQAAILKNLLTAWSPAGTAGSYARLRLSAFMPLWLLGAVAGFLLLKTLGKKAAALAKQLWQALKEKQKARYPGQMKGSIAGAVLLGLLGAAAIAGCVYGFLAYLTLPLYTFTDWIPEAFVDPDAVIATAKNLLTAAAPATVSYSRATTAFRLYAAWIRWGSLLLAAGIAVRTVTRIRLRREDPSA